MESVMDKIRPALKVILYPIRPVLALAGFTSVFFGFPSIKLMTPKFLQRLDNGSASVHQADAAPQAPASGYYLLVLVGDTDPYLDGPHASHETIGDLAIKHRKDNGDSDGLYWLRNTPTGPVVGAFGALDLEEQ